MAGEKIKQLNEKAKGWRTIIVNGLIMFVVVLAEVTVFLTSLNWREYVPAEYLGLVIIGINVLNIVLRYVTTGPTPLREKIDQWRS